jgi:hypothetical protein
MRNSFAGPGSSGPQIADITDPATGSLVPLLPPNQVSNPGFLANPQNYNVAFLSLQGDTLSLFIANGDTLGGQPRKLLDIGTNRRGYDVIMGWTP